MMTYYCSVRKFTYVSEEIHFRDERSLEMVRVRKSNRSKKIKEVKNMIENVLLVLREEVHLCVLKKFSVVKWEVQKKREF